MRDITYLRRALLLQSWPKISSRRLSQLLYQLGGIDALWQSSPASWPGEPVPDTQIRSFEKLREYGRAARAGIDIEAQLATLQHHQASVIDIASDNYPPLLRTIHDPPPLLYTRGNDALLCHPQLAIIGSRKASSAGLRAARELAAAAVAAGLVVTSGLALGIDGEAHRGALAGGGSTLAVMATGIDVIYPRRHAALGVNITAAGCLLSELPPGCGPHRQHFPRRNRIISGLALGVLIVEAALPSGSLITARSALEQGREVFALPWSIYHPGGRGCLHLLRDGATLLQGVDDLWQEVSAMVGLQRQLSLPKPDAIPADEPVLLQLIGDGEVSVQVLVEASGQTLPTVMAQLSELELKGQVCLGAGGYSRRQAAS
ncbi:MAG: DNA-processing protein DprA [Parahaliea sp.]